MEKETGKLIAGVGEEELDGFLRNVLEKADLGVQKHFGLSGPVFEVETLVKPMKDLFFRTDIEKYRDKSLEERWGIFLQKISEEVTHRELYTHMRQGKLEKRDNVLLFSGTGPENIPPRDLNSAKSFLTDEQKEELTGKTVVYANEANFIILWCIFENLGREMFLANRRQLREKSEEFEPRYPGTTPEYLRSYETILKLENLASEIKGRSKSTATVKIPDDKIKDMLQATDCDVFYSLRECYDGCQSYYNFIDKLWKRNNPGAKGYFEKNGCENVYTSDEETNKTLHKLARDFVESYLSNDLVQKKLYEEARKSELIIEKIKTQPLRPIPKPSFPSDYEYLYKSEEGQESSFGFWHYEKPDVTDEIFKNRDNLPIAKFLNQFIVEGGTNLTCDKLLSVEFARGANNAFIVTNSAIPTSNILGTSELPVILDNVSKTQERRENFEKNNPIMPITNVKPGADIKKSDVLLVTGEYMANRWKEQKEGGRLTDPENRKKFLENLFGNLNRRARKYLNDQEKLKKLDKTLKKLREQYNSREKKDIKYLASYGFDKKKSEYLEKIYEDEENSMTSLNEIALKLQEKSMLESSLGIKERRKKEKENYKKAEIMREALGGLVRPPATTFSSHVNRFKKRQQSEKDQGTARNGP
ncbi:MAG: hypothetical protein LBP39_02475 [Rickettsiales bacterium]|jgi:hypothetical protein|nr:hypothetical protein [Rickettsiales bacterium]